MPHWPEMQIHAHTADELEEMFYCGEPMFTQQRQLFAPVEAWAVLLAKYPHIGPMLAWKTTDPALLTFLADDIPGSDYPTSSGVAGNRWAPLPVLLALTSHPQTRTRVAVALNDSLPDEVADSLATDPDASVRSAVRRRYDYRAAHAARLAAVAAAEAEVQRLKAERQEARRRKDAWRREMKRNAKELLAARDAAGGSAVGKSPRARYQPPEELPDSLAVQSLPPQAEPQSSPPPSQSSPPQPLAAATRSRAGSG
jgi:hypothetical protein